MKAKGVVVSTYTYENHAALANLSRRWWIFLAVSGLFVAGGVTFLAKTWHWVYALGWVLPTVVILTYLLWLFGANLLENHRIGESRLLTGLGWGNILTLARGILFAGLVGFVFLPKPPGFLIWAPALFYTVGALLDFVDGYAARVSNHVTKLGERLDMSLDGIGLLFASILAVRYGQVPAWYLLVGAARYLYLAGLWLRQRLGLPVGELPPSPVRRPFAGLQMGFAFVMLWPIFTPPATYHAAYFFALPFLINFFLDWLVASQSIPPDYSAGLQRYRQFALCWFPLGLRLGIGLILGQGLIAGSAVELQSPQAFLTALQLLAAGFVLIGFAGRVAAILGLIILGVYQNFQPLTMMQIILAWMYGVLMYLGTGVLSAWKPEDILIHRRAGEKQP